MSHFANEVRNNWSTSHYANKQAIMINKVLAAIKKEFSVGGHISPSISPPLDVSHIVKQQQQLKDFFWHCVQMYSLEDVP